MIRPALISLLLVAPAAAQTPAEAMARAWETFKTTCQAALFDQSTFIAETPNPGPNGVAAVARTPDGQIIEARRFPDNQMITLRITGLPGQRLNFCSTHEQGFNAAEIDLTLGRDPTPWVEAFEAIVRPAAPAPIVGGDLPIGFVAKGMAGEIIAQHDTISRHYASLFEWQGEKIPITIIVAPYSIIFTAHRIEVAQ